MASWHIVRLNQGLLSSTTALCAYLDKESAESKPYESGVLRDCGDHSTLDKFLSSPLGCVAAVDWVSGGQLVVGEGQEE